MPVELLDEANRPRDRCQATLNRTEPRREYDAGGPTVRDSEGESKRAAYCSLRKA